MGISLEQALKRCDFRGVRALPLFAPFNAFRRRYRLIGLLEITVNQAFVGFEGFGRREPESFALPNIVRFPQDLHKNI